MPQDKGYTYDELVKMGAKPGGYTYDELVSAGAKGSVAAPVASDGGSIAARPPSLPEAAWQKLKDLNIGATGALGDFIQTGGQWVESMAGRNVTAGRTTATGRDVYAPTNTTQQVGNIGGKVAIGLAGGVAGKLPSLARSMLAGGLTGAMQNPDEPYIPAALGMAGPVVGAAIGALPNSRRAGAALEEIKRMAANRGVDTSKAQTVVERAQELGRAGSSPPSVITKFDKRVMGAKGQGNPPLTYSESFDFASKAKKLSSAEKFAMDAPMGAQVDRFVAALQTANRDVAASIGKGKQFDAAMKEYRQAMKIQDAGQLVKQYGPKALIGSGLLYAITQKYLD